MDTWTTTRSAQLFCKLLLAVVLPLEAPTSERLRNLFCIRIPPDAPWRCHSWPQRRAGSVSQCCSGLCGCDRASSALVKRLRSGSEVSSSPIEPSLGPLVADWRAGLCSRERSVVRVSAASGVCACVHVSILALGPGGFALRVAFHGVLVASAVQEGSGLSSLPPLGESCPCTSARVDRSLLRCILGVFAVALSGTSRPCAGSRDLRVAALAGRDLGSAARAARPSSAMAARTPSVSRWRLGRRSW